MTSYHSQKNAKSLEVMCLKMNLGVNVNYSIFE